MVIETIFQSALTEAGMAVAFIAYLMHNNKTLAGSIRSAIDKNTEAINKLAIWLKTKK